MPADNGGVPGCLSRVRESCQYVCEISNHVSISTSGLEHAASQFTPETLQSLTSEQSFDAELHLVGEGDLTAQYTLVLDALNFCFWPEEGLEYEHMARGLKETVKGDPAAISAERLLQMSEGSVAALVKRENLPLQSERARLLREVGQVLMTHFSGQASTLISRAERSAERLVDLVTSHFPGFQDHTVYKGRQVFLYKRAQIFVGDIWGSFKGRGLGSFHDIHKLTMFADYRVPVVLRELGVLKYDEDLGSRVQNQVVLISGSEEEVEIRASSIEATDRLCKILRDRHQIQLHNLQMDWWLWEQGERLRKEHPPHHRTLTIFY